MPLPGLKREAGANPAWSRHCNWREPPQFPFAESSHWPLIYRAGKALRRFVSSQKPGDLPGNLDGIRFAARCISLLTVSSLTGKVRLFLCPSRSVPVRNQPVQWRLPLDSFPRDGRVACAFPAAQFLLLCAVRRRGPLRRAVHPAIFPPSPAQPNARRRVALSAHPLHNRRQPNSPRRPPGGIIEMLRQIRGAN